MRDFSLLSAGAFLRNQVLYFDHNSTTFVAPEVAAALEAAVRDVFGNASSTHRAGQLARQRFEAARATVANAINATPNEIVFTSGGTESNNLAIFGLAAGVDGEVVATSIEHPSVLECCRQLNGCRVVHPDEVHDQISDRTVLVSVMHANNETGSIQNISEIAEIVRKRRDNGQEIYLHSDGVQALGKIPVDVRALGVDLYSISAHKVFAPKGVGALYVRRGVPLNAVQHGGRHEQQRRAGTENVPGAIAFATALDLSRPQDEEHLRDLRDFFEAEILRRVSDVEVTAIDSPRLPNTSSILFRGVSAEALVIALDMRGMAVSTGAACSSGSIEPSHVLLATGRSIAEAKSSVRFSFGRYNTREEVGQLVDAVVSCIGRLRAGSLAEVQLVS